MLFRNSTHILRLAIILILCATASSYGYVINADQWRKFGNQTLYFFGSDRCPAPGWLNRRQQLLHAFAKPNMRESISVVELFLEQILEGYEQDSFAWQDRIRLDINPRCIFGLYLVDKFPGTKLAVVGKQQFEQSVERSCLVALGITTPWQQVLEAELTKPNLDYLASFQPESFDRSEVPFLLIYLIENGSSEVIKQKARKLLSDCLLERYGLEPALRQYCILLEQGGITFDEQTCLEVAKQLEQTGAICDAKQLYERIIQNTDSIDIATEAAKNMVRIKLANSQQIHVREVIDVLRRRFPDIELKIKDLKDFFPNFQTDHQERAKQLVDELITTQKQEEALRLCRLCNDLWSGQELSMQWQNVIDSAEPGGLACQFARLYLARNLVNSGKVNKAKDMLDGLSDSIYTTVRARTLLVLADSAQSMDRTSEAVTLYLQAASIERPTVLPQWFKSFQITQLDINNMSAKELSYHIPFLRAYNEMIDGNFERGVVDFLKAKEIACKTRQNSMLSKMNKTIPVMLMLAYVKMGDYARAEEYGLEAIRNFEEQGEESKQSTSFIYKITRIDHTLFELFREMRALQQPGSKSQSERYARNIYIAVTKQNLLDTGPKSAESSLMYIFWQIKKQRVARLLFAEYSLADARLKESNGFRKLLNLEPVIFAAQLLDKGSFEQISKSLVAAAQQEYTKGLIYRFAKFSQEVGQPYMTRMALNVAVRQIDNAGGNVELLENIADMYLKGNSHQKAIEIYERIVEEASDANEAQKAQFEIIKVYAEQLKLYDKAIQECQKFLKNFSGSEQVSQVEFLIGKLAYLNKDYTGATGQLDSFQRKYLNSPEVGQAMMLAALGRMSERATDDAIDRFTEIIQTYPNSDMAARSKLLIGHALVSEQKYSQALETFRQLVEQYPKSQYVEHAKSFIERLSRISQ
ncbi:MAG: tetratricopeptide repeat protein [Planctomycetes bacterium]|nr:tetratricopeptide repeat protein [Planctomycetota bacterium]